MNLPKSWQEALDRTMDGQKEEEVPPVDDDTCNKIENLIRQIYNAGLERAAAFAHEEGDEWLALEIRRMKM